MEIPFSISRKSRVTDVNLAPFPLRVFVGSQPESPLCFPAHLLVSFSLALSARDLTSTSRAVGVNLFLWRRKRLAKALGALCSPGWVPGQGEGPAILISFNKPFLWGLLGGLSLQVRGVYPLHHMLWFLAAPGYSLVQAHLVVTVLPCKAGTSVNPMISTAISCPGSVRE